MVYKFLFLVKLIFCKPCLNGKSNDLKSLMVTIYKEFKSNS